MRKLIVVGIALAWCQQPAWAGCTGNGTTGTNISVQALAANDLGNGRDFLFVQNTGTNPMNVAIGTNNNATSHDILLNGGSSLVFQTYGHRAVPNGDIAIISAMGTSYAICDF